MQTNWTAIITTIVTAVVGITCAVVALTLGKDNSAASGVLFGIAGAALGSFIKQPQKRGDDAGHALLSSMFLLVLVAFALLMLIALCARADTNDPRTGGCIATNVDGTCKASYQLSMQAPMAAINLKTGDALYGANAIALGPCYGVTYQPSRWYASGLDACVAFRVASSQPNQYIGALMLHSLKFGAIGVGTQGIQDSGRMIWQGMLFFSPRLSLQ